jgi:hypothetical protein
VHGTRGTGQPLSRPLLDTLRIELPRAPTPHRGPRVAPRGQSPLVPSPPAVPPLRLESTRAASLKLDLPKVDQVLATILSTTTGPSSRDSSPENSAVVAASEVDRLPELLGNLTPRYPDELRRAGLSARRCWNTSSTARGGLCPVRSASYALAIQRSLNRRSSH